MVNTETERLFLRPIEDSDWRAVQKIWDDQTRSEYAVYDNPKDLSDEAVCGMVKRWAAHQSREHIFLVACRKDGEVIGFINFHLHDDRHEISYGFLKEAQGQGYAREAVSTAIRSLGGEGIRRFSAGTGLKNTPSVNLLEAVGFRRIGTEKVSFYNDANGKAIWFDGGIFELTLQQ